MNFLAGYKEKITAILAGVSLILASFGVAPDMLKPLDDVANAVSTGNWQAALASFVGGILLLMRAFARMKQDREAEVKTGVKAAG